MARRLLKKQPLFAYCLMREAYPDYTHEQFLDDLRYRRPPKKRKGKNGIQKYGRYCRMEELLLRYRQDGNIAHALQAQKLRERMAKPYRVRVTIGSCRLEYGFSPLVPIAVSSIWSKRSLGTVRNRKLTGSYRNFGKQHT